MSEPVILYRKSGARVLELVVNAPSEVDNYLAQGWSRSVADTQRAQDSASEEQVDAGDAQDVDAQKTTQSASSKRRRKATE